MRTATAASIGGVYTFVWLIREVAESRRLIFALCGTQTRYTACATVAPSLRRYFMTMNVSAQLVAVTRERMRKEKAARRRAAAAVIAYLVIASPECVNQPSWMRL